MNVESLYPYCVIFLRSALSFIVLILLTNGKKQLSQLTLFDYITGITVASIAASLAIDIQIPLGHGLMGLMVWTLLPIAVSKITLRNTRIKSVLGGVPSILVQNGKIVYENLRNENFSVVELLEELRLKDVFNICDVEFAILEASGKISIQLKSSNKALGPKDLDISTHYNGLSANLILDGEIMYAHLKVVNLKEDWLKNELKKRNIASPKDVVLAFLDARGKLHVDLKSKSSGDMNVLE